jgi:tRNA pseudouridine13 synthase
VAELELEQLRVLQSWCDGLEHVGLDQERRQLQLLSAGFSYQLDDADLTLKFTLPPGCYATSILRELCLLREAPKEMPASGDVV